MHILWGNSSQSDLEECATFVAGDGLQDMSMDFQPYCCAGHRDAGPFLTLLRMCSILFLEG
jgi:hypothetical protein